MLFLTGNMRLNAHSLSAMLIDFHALPSRSQPTTSPLVEEGRIYTPATASALGTPELLEMILSQMDMRTLLTSQRVCRDWRDLIKTSPSIQKLLFFTPTNSIKGRAEERTFNPLLIKTFPSVFPAEDRPYGMFDLDDLSMTKDDSALDRFVRKEASWRRMLVQQPPIFEVRVFNVRSALGGTSVERSSIPADPDMQKEYGQGLRMERLFEVLLLSHWYHNPIYWATGESSGVYKYNWLSDKIVKKFYRELRRYGVVIHSRAVKQCAKGKPPFKIIEGDPLNEVRDEIIAAYEEHGLDAYLKKERINGSEKWADDWPDPVQVYD